MATNC